LTLDPKDLRALPIFPLPNAALFPGTALPLHVFEPRYRDLVRDALAGSRALAVARLRPGFEENYEGRPAVFDVCGAGTIVEHVARDDGRYDVLLRGVTRVRILNEHPPLQTYRLVNAEAISDSVFDPALAAAFQERLRALWPVLAPHLPESLRDLTELTRGAEGAGRLSDRLAALLFRDADLTQTLLVELDAAERLRLITDELAEVAARLSSSPRGAMN
jgi:Lon protease-like protein